MYVHVEVLVLSKGYLSAGYLMVKVLLHFSDSKKGSSFGLKSTPNNVIKKRA